MACRAVSRVPALECSWSKGESLMTNQVLISLVLFLHYAWYKLCLQYAPTKLYGPKWTISAPFVLCPQTSPAHTSQRRHGLLPQSLWPMSSGTTWLSHCLLYLKAQPLLPTMGKFPFFCAFLLWFGLSLLRSYKTQHSPKLSADYKQPSSAWFNNMLHFSFLSFPWNGMTNQSHSTYPYSSQSSYMAAGGWTNERL